MKLQVGASSESTACLHLFCNLKLPRQAFDLAGETICSASGLPWGVAGASFPRKITF